MKSHISVNLFSKKLSKTYIGEIIASVGGKTAYPHFET
jgi:hypothetical protein